MSDSPVISVLDVPERSRYEAMIDGEFAGFCDHRREGDVVILPHTVVDPAFEGRGVGSALARFALDHIRTQGLTVDPQCSFIAAWIERHPTYADLVTHRTA